MMLSHIALPPKQEGDDTLTTNAAARWKAVVHRDATKNSFVYAVRSTRIYCRPGCPARLARRANVEFFDSPATASTAGYRACKRCKPDMYHRAVTATTSTEEEQGQRNQASDPIQNPPHRVMIAKTCQAISSAVVAGRNPPVLRDLAREAGLTASHFHRVFKKVAGVTPGQYACNVRDAAAAAAFTNPTTATTAITNGENRTETETPDINCESTELTVQAGVPNSALTLDDLIDWDEFDKMMKQDEACINMSFIC